MKNFIQSVFILTTLLRSTTGAEEVLYAQEGETVTLKPPQGVISQGDYVYWHFGGNDGPKIAWRNPLGGKETGSEECKKPGATDCIDNWQNKLSLTDTSLIINKIQQKHFGTFVCKVKVNNNFKIVAIFKVCRLNVTVNPDSLLLTGEQVTLNCNAETPQGHKKPVIHWLKPQGEIIYKESHTMRVTSESNGQWTCVVTNDGKQKEAKVSIAVVDLSPAPSSSPKYTSKSTPLNIPCSISPHISWDQMKKKGVQEVCWDFFPKQGSSGPQRLFSLSLEDPVKWNVSQSRGLSPAPDVKDGKLSLTRNRGREEDEGDYVCSLKFKNGITLTRRIHVYMLQIIASPATDLISGQQVNLTCSLGQKLPPDLHLKLFAPAESSLPPRTFVSYPAFHTITEAGTGDRGRWRCELWQNNTRLTLAVLTLQIEHKLSVWMLVTICSVTVIIVLLLILLFILCQRRKRKMRHLRHRLCQCKNPKPKGFYRT